ncbi:leucine-rich repeat-containing protein 15-like [Branchiostoma floridae]|uniref:Leucine-rich repeat-containing protein 15-like n=1 Tax=Branchiostoma floridae TaxID=7739 RepID=A0A9J7MD10_BRAFL|nr:leucine-rich repeat-containing protein 15-like [Branchiostoma floridae]
MGKKLQHMLIFLLIILKELNMLEADCSCIANCVCVGLGVTRLPRRIPTSISTVTFVDNKISDIPPATFSNLPELQELHLQKNQLTYILSGTFSDLPKLKQLSLFSNKIRHIEPGAFENLPKLQRLILYGNRILNIQKGTFSNLPQLNWLELPYNKITSIQSHVFSNLPLLKRLRLEYNKITSIQSHAFSNLLQLKSLVLNSNQLTEIQPGIFSNLPKLATLYLLENKITSIQSDTFSNLPELKLLYLSCNKIRHIQSGSFSNLSILDLRDNDVSIRLVGQKLKDADLNGQICKHTMTTESTTPVDVSTIPLFTTTEGNNSPTSTSLGSTIATLPVGNQALFTSSVVPISSAFSATKTNNNPTSNPLNPKFATLSVRNQASPTTSAVQSSCDMCTVTSRYHWYFERNSDSVFSTAPSNNNQRKVLAKEIVIVQPTLILFPITGPSHRSGPSLSVIFSPVAVAIAIVTIPVTIILVVWCKVKKNCCPSGPKSKFVFNNIYPTFAVTDNGHHQTSQCQAITVSTTNTTTAEMTSGHDQTGLGQSQTKSESIASTTMAEMTTGHDQTSLGQSQSFDEPIPNTTAVDVHSGYDQTMQAQSHAITKTLQGMVSLRTTPIPLLLY